MVRSRVVSALLALGFLISIGSVYAIEVPSETYTLPNGMTVILHEDHSLPQVTINTWFAVGSKDEAPGRTGFAHLFEHLMFMGTARVPDNQYDIQMEIGGGTNNASTSTDRTNYYSWGPSELLPTLLWLDADRLEALGENMTQKKLDLQREVVRNERRQNLENTPYGITTEIIPAAIYPKGHPYHHPIIGSHEDLEAASVEDVKGFFANFYVPGNASLVVAGDFDPAEVRELLARTFGTLPAKPVPEHAAAQPVTLEREIRRVAVDQVELAQLTLVWHSPAVFSEGDAEMDLVADLLADGPSSRLYKALVIEQKLAQSVVAYQYSKELGSEFRVQVTARPGADLETIKRSTIEVIERFKEQGPSPRELQRVIASRESAFLRRMERLSARADALNRYRHYLGRADGFEDDLARFTSATPDSIVAWSARVFGPGRLDLRIFPKGATIAGGTLDQRPEPFASGLFSPPTPTVSTLSNGLPVYTLSRPGTGLFAGALIIDGGESLIPVSKAGLSPIAAEMLTAGAAGRDATEFADAVALLGADVEASGGRNEFTVYVQGLSTRLPATLDLFADAVLRPAIEQDDFEREASLALNRVRTRADDPSSLAFAGARVLAFGRDDPRGRPVSGFASTVQGIGLEDLSQALPALLDPSRAKFLFVGDFQAKQLTGELEDRFGTWQSQNTPTSPKPEPITALEKGSLTLVDRPGAPQTMIVLLRPIPAVPPREEARRTTLNILFGSSFTSRLNQNLREKNGYTYGARSLFTDDGQQFLLMAYSAVQTEVTAAALGEFRAEFNRLSAGTVTEEERLKAVKTLRQGLVDRVGTTGSLLGAFEQLLTSAREIDHLGNLLETSQAVTLKNLNALAQSGLYDWDGLQILLVGDRQAIEAQLENAGFPPAKILDVKNLL